MRASMGTACPRERFITDAPVLFDFCSVLVISELEEDVRLHSLLYYILVKAIGNTVVPAMVVGRHEGDGRPRWVNQRYV